METFEQTNGLSHRNEFAGPFGLSENDHALFVIAHPDDELLIGGSLLTLLKQQQPLDIVVLTNGEQSTRGNRDFVQSGKRKYESIAALATYGAHVDQQRYLALPDAFLHTEAVAALGATALSTLIVKKQTKAIITAGAYGYDGHSDHIAAHAIALTAAQSVADLHNANITVWGLSERPGDESFAVDPYDKLAALSRHYSQFDLHGAEPFRKHDWVSYGGYDMSPETAHLLTPYAALLTSESYNSTFVSPTAHSYAIIKEKQGVLV